METRVEGPFSGSVAADIHPDMPKHTALTPAEAVIGKQVESCAVPSVGRVVHYVLPMSNGLRPHVAGEHRPATIVKVWGQNDPDAAVQLAVQLDGTNDKEGWSGETFWATSVGHDETHKDQGSWHWPEYVSNIIREVPE